MWRISIKFRLMGVSPTSPATCSPVPSPRSVLWPRLWAWASASHLCVAGGPWWILWGQQILSCSWFSSALQSGVAFSSRQKHWLGSTCFQSAHKCSPPAQGLPDAQTCGGCLASVSPCSKQHLHFYPRWCWLQMLPNQTHSPEHPFWKFFWAEKE